MRGWLARFLIAFFLALAPWPRTPAHAESYDIRPDILALPAESNDATPRYAPPRWPEIKRGMLRAVAELLTFYPKDVLYFVGRDGEYVYDLARALLRDDPAQLARIRLINVSAANLKDPHLGDYLDQIGFNASALGKSRAIVVDTGYQGTIFSFVSRALEPGLRGRVGAHLLVSQNPRIPSSRVFIESLDPAVIAGPPSRFRATIVAYEHLPHYTAKSDRFALEGGKWTPISRELADTERVHRLRSQSLMTDLARFADEPEVRREFLDLHRNMGVVYRALRDPGASVRGLSRAVKALRKRGVETFFQDAYEHYRLEGPERGGIEMSHVRRLAYGVPFGEPPVELNPLAAVARDPAIEPYLLHPSARIPTLSFDDRELIPRLISVLDREGTRMLVDALEKDPRFLDHPEIAEAVIHGPHGDRMTPFLARPAAAEHPNGVGLLRSFIDLQISPGAAADEILSRPEWAASPEGFALIRDFIRKENGNLFIGSVLGQPHWAARPDAAELFREVVRSGRGGINALSGVLARPGWAARPDATQLLELLVRGEVPDHILERDVLRKPEWTELPRLRRALAGKRPTNSRLRKLFAGGFSFSAGCGSRFGELLKSGR